MAGFPGSGDGILRGNLGEACYAGVGDDGIFEAGGPLVGYDKGPPHIPKPKWHASELKNTKQADKGSQVLIAWFDRDVMVGLGGVYGGEHPGPQAGGWLNDSICCPILQLLLKAFNLGRFETSVLGLDQLGPRQKLYAKRFPVFG